MPSFLADPPQWMYLVLGGLLVVTGAVATQKQDRRAVTAFGIAFLLMLFLFLLDRVGESPREEAIRRVHLMGMAADAKNPDAFVEHIADKVEVQTDQGRMQPATRDELKNAPFWTLLRQFNVRVTVDSFAREDVKVIDDNTIEIGFVAKGDPQSGQRIPIYCRATFGKQSDGSFKLTAIKAFEFVNRTQAIPISLPQK
jgi:hypothetical protein